MRFVLGCLFGVSFTLSLMFHASADAFAASSKSTTPKPVTVRNRNRHLFEYKGGDLVCYADSGQRSRIPGKIIKVQTRSSGKQATRKVFYSLKDLTADSLRRLRHSRTRSSNQLKVRTKQLFDKLHSQQRLCNLRPFVFADLRLRWFPSDQATGYFIYIIGPNGVIIRQEEALPSGCTHRLVEGFTSGLCLFEIHTAGLPAGSAYKISAFNSVGESAAAAPS